MKKSIWLRIGARHKDFTNLLFSLCLIQTLPFRHVSPVHHELSSGHTMEVLASHYLTTWSSGSETEQLAVHLDNEWCIMTTHGVKCLKGQMFMSKMKAPTNN